MTIRYGPLDCALNSKTIVGMDTPNRRLDSDWCAEVEPKNAIVLVARRHLARQEVPFPTADLRERLRLSKTMLGALELTNRVRGRLREERVGGLLDPHDIPP